MVMLVVMKGHPGCGKSTLARALGGRLKCPVIDKDDIRDCSFHLQQALSLSSSTAAVAAAAAILNDFSYDVMWRIVQTQLQLGITVIVDCPLSRPRLFLCADSLAALYGARLVVLECVSSDSQEWKRRLEARSLPEINLSNCGLMCNEESRYSVEKATSSSRDGRFSRHISEHSEEASSYGPQKNQLAEYPVDLLRNPEKCLHSDLLQSAHSHGLCREACQYSVDKTQPSSGDGHSSHICDHSEEVSGYDQQKTLAENPENTQKNPQNFLHSDLLQSAQSHGLCRESCQCSVEAAPPSNEDGCFSHIRYHSGEASGYGRQKTLAEYPEDLLRNPEKHRHSHLKSAQSHGLCREACQYSIEEAPSSSKEGDSTHISDHSVETAGYDGRKTLAESSKGLPERDPTFALHQSSFARDQGLHREAYQLHAKGARLSKESAHSSNNIGDVFEVSCRPREWPMTQGWHKPSSWEDLQKLIADYKGCWEYETPGARKLVVDTTSGMAHSQDDILDWILLQLQDLSA